MKFDVEDEITLSDDKKYLVASKVSYEGKVYYYLMDVNDYSNLKFCYENEGKLTQIQDNEMIKVLLPLFISNMREDLDI